MNRRKFVVATGATLASIGLAGCSSDADGSTGGTEVSDGSAGSDGSGGSSGGSDGSSGGTGDDEFDLSSVDGTLGDNVSENVEVTEHRAFQTADDVGVTGVIKNTSGQQLEFVEVEVTLNDGDTVIGEFVDTSDEEIDSLGAGKQWRFWLTFDDEELGSDTSYSIEVEAEVADDADEATATGTDTSTESGTATTTADGTTTTSN
jgi:hypothetical protein